MTSLSHCFTVLFELQLVQRLSLYKPCALQVRFCRFLSQPVSGLNIPFRTRFAHTVHWVNFHSSMNSFGTLYELSEERQPYGSRSLQRKHFLQVQSSSSSFTSELLSPKQLKQLFIQQKWLLTSLGRVWEELNSYSLLLNGCSSLLPFTVTQSNLLLTFAFNCLVDCIRNAHVG